MADVSLTRRGRIVAGVCVLAAVMAVVVGGRSLNAVVLPGAVGLAAGYLQITRIEPPGSRRTGVADGFVGETRGVRVEFHGDRTGAPVERGFVADVRDGLSDGLSGPTDPIRTAVGDEPTTYEATYADRGSVRFGPIEIVATDVLGLFSRSMHVDDTDDVVVYPECHPIPAWFRRRLYADDALGASQQREEFDRLREYARGDAVRDVDWSATAKHDEIVVKEFAAETEHRRVSIAGETLGTSDRAADLLAGAAASLTLSLLDDGIPVELSLPTGTVAVEPGPRGRRIALERTAHVGSGSVAGADAADVHVAADSEDAEVRAGETVVDYEDLREEGTAAGAPARGVDGAVAGRGDAGSAAGRGDAGRGDAGSVAADGAGVTDGDRGAEP